MEKDNKKNKKKGSNNNSKAIKPEEKKNVETKKVDTKKVDTKKIDTKNDKIAKANKLVKGKVSKKDKFLKKFEELDNHKTPIITFICGLALGLLILLLVYPDRIATLKDGTQPVAKVKGTTITANDLYEDMKDYYSVSILLDKIDNIILEKKYPETDDMKKEVEETAEYWLNMYEQQGYDQESFLSNNGFEDYDAFLEYLTLDHRRNTYYDEYVEDSITDDEINKYYEENVYGETDTKHILVSVKDDSDEDSEGLSDDDAKALAEEIIKKLDDGTSWDDVIEEYGDQITSEELGYQAYNASLEEEYITEMLSLENDTYSKEPVKTSYGYHIVYRIDQKDKPKLKDVKDDVISDISSNKKEEDSTLYYKALNNLREKSKLEFTDSVLKKKYNEYLDEKTKASS